MSKEITNLLLDKTASYNEREHAAAVLNQYDSSEVKDALFRVANDLTENKWLRATCGSSLALIWMRINQFDLDSLLKLQDIAKVYAIDEINTYEPTWYKEYLKRC